ncbi:MAG: immunoglobulin domain-containing protein [Verrucomicrobiales bacterium]|nr:immunoglobulin domain-containing protein [Verrucomicrobiales bacterium]
MLGLLALTLGAAGARSQTPPPEEPLAPPRIEGAGGPLHFQPGFPAEINFTLSGGAPNSLTWLQDGSPVNIDRYPLILLGPRLFFVGAKEEQEGTYQLIAENASGRAESEIVTVTVDDGDPIVITPHGGTFTNSVTVTAEVVATPPRTWSTSLSYTLDGSIPNGFNDTRYTGPVVLTGDANFQIRETPGAIPSGRTHRAEFRIIPPPLPEPGPEARLMAHYRFDESSGTTARDETGWQPGALSASGVSFHTPGAAGNAVQFRRDENGFVTLSDAATPWSGAWTLSLWFRTTPGETRSMALIGMGGIHVSGGFHVGLNLYGSAVAAYAGDGRTLTSAAVVNDGQWHHLALVRALDGDTRLHLDGGAARARNINGPVVPNGVPLQLGAFGTPGDTVDVAPLEGAIDDLQIYNVALPEPAVNLLAQQPGQPLDFPLRPGPASPPNLIAESSWVVSSPDRSVTLTYRADGDPAFALQWFHQGQPIPGAHDLTLTLPSVTAEDAGTYFVTAENTVGSSQSKRITLNVTTSFFHPVAPGAPNDLELDRGSALHMAYPTTWHAPTAVQWYHNDTPIPGATGRTHDFDTLTLADRGDYYARLDTADGPFWSSVGRIEFLPLRAPIPLDTPISLVGFEGEPRRFTPEFAGSRPMSFQWLHGDVEIPGATQATLEFPSPRPSDTGTYFVRASNEAGTVTHGPYTLNTTPAPTLVFDPPGGPAPDTLTLLYIPDDRYFFIRYTLDGSEPTAESPLFSTSIPITKTTTVKAALYSGNAQVGPVVTREFILPAGAPVITVEPQDWSVAYGERIQLSVRAEGAPPMRYTWYLDGLSPETTTTPVLPTTIATWTAMQYYVVVQNNLGTATSRKARITVRPGAVAPPIVQPLPSTTTVYEGASATLQLFYSSVTWTTFAWFRDGVEIPGATSHTLTLNSVSTDMAGDYSVRVTYRDGVLWSGPTRLTVRRSPRSTPTILTQPSDLSVGERSRAGLSVNVTSPSPATYAWYHNDQRLEGETGPTLIFTKARQAHAGKYYVVVSNEAGSVRSAIVTVTVTLSIQANAPYVVFGPWDGTFPAAATLTSAAPQPGQEIRYTTDGTPPHELSPLYTAPLSLPDEATVFAAIFEDGFRLSHVAEANFTRSPVPPSILEHATLVQADPNRALYLGLQLAGTAPFEIEWYLNGARVYATTNRLSPESRLAHFFATPILGKIQTYHAVVRNRAGSVQSAPIRVYGLEPGSPILVPPSITGQPAAAAAAHGLPVTLEVAATGSAPLQYHWSIPGAGTLTTTKPWLTLDQAQLSYSGEYFVTVENALDAVRSKSAPLTVVRVTGDAPPVILRQPHDVSSAEGSPTTLFIDALGPPPLRYHWKIGSAAIVTTSQPWMTLPAVGTEHAGPYSVTVENGAASVSSTPAMLQVLSRDLAPLRPWFTDLTGERQATEGGSFTLNAWSLGSSITAYHWRLASGLFITTPTPSLTLSAVRADQAGPYFLIVESPNGNAISEPAMLRVLPLAAQPPPVIVRQPSSQSVPYGAQVTLSVEATSTLPLSYTWTFNGTQTLPYHASSITLDRVAQTRSGTYRVKVSHRDGQVESLPAVLTVGPATAPAFTQAPADVMAEEGGFAQLTCAVTGDPPLKFVWRFEGSVRYESELPELLLGNVGPSVAGTYVVEVSNPGGTARSAPFTLTVRPAPPRITQQPRRVQTYQGADATFDVGLTGSAPLAYQWRFNGEAISGATNTSLHLTALQPHQSGLYDVVVSNGAGTVNSDPAALEVDDLSGGTIQFVNRVTGLLDAPIYDEDGVTLLAGPAFVAQLFAGASPESLAPVGPIAPFRTGIGAGYWDPQGESLRRLKTVRAGNVAWVQVRAWAVADGASYEEAKSAQAAVGESSLLQVITGGAGLPPSLPSLLVGLESFQLRRMPPPVIVQEPDPQTLALGLGAPLSLNVVARGESLRYQWFRDGTPLALPGADTPTLAVASTTEADTGRYHVRVSNPGGRVDSREIMVTVGLHHTLSLRTVGSVYEGGIPRVPLDLVSRGGVGRVSAHVRYDPAVLEYLDTEWPSSPAPTHLAESLSPGLLQLTLAHPAGFSHGTNTLGFLLFRARDIPEPLSSPVVFENLEFADPSGAVLLWGLAHRDTAVEVFTRAVIGDNNANGLFDLGDPALINTLITRTVPVPKWVIADNDFDANGRLDRADLVASLETLAAHDLESLRPASPSSTAPRSRSLHGAGTSTSAPILISAEPRLLVPDALVTLRVELPSGIAPLRATAFTLRHPAAAFSVVAHRVLAPAKLWTDPGSYAVRSSPAPNAAGDVRTRFAATTGQAWSSSGGILVEWDLRVLPTATSNSSWQITLEDVVWTLDGYQLHAGAESTVAFQVPPASPAVPASLTRIALPEGSSADPILIEGLGTPSHLYRLQVATILGVWTDATTLQADSDGRFRFTHPMRRETNPHAQFFRVLAIPAEVPSR